MTHRTRGFRAAVRINSDQVHARRSEGIKTAMSPVEKALWYIEGHLRLDISLADIAAGACVSRHHLLRAFGAATGLSVMRYVRGRRLSEAAQRLAGGAGDILSVAIDAGYNSHEAFTRAFGEQFGMTPGGSSSARKHRAGSHWCSPSRWTQRRWRSKSPRFEDLDVLLVAGLNRRYGGLEDSAGVPGQWQQFGVEQAQIRGRVGPSGVRRLLQPRRRRQHGLPVRHSSRRASARRLRSSHACAFRGAGTQYSSIASTSPAFAGPGTRSGTAGCRAPATRSRTRRCSSDTTITFIHRSGRGGFSLLVPLS